MDLVNTGNKIQAAVNLASEWDKILDFRPRFRNFGSEFFLIFSNFYASTFTVI